MLGENNHNNHHGAPSSISAWHEWWEIDVWGPVVHLLQFIGLIRMHTDFRESRVHPETTDLGMRRGRYDLITSHEPITFWQWRDDPCPIWLQWGLILLFYYFLFKWRQRNAMQPVPDHGVTAMFTVLALLAIAQGLFFVYSDPTLLTVATDPANFISSGVLRQFATAVCRVVLPLHDQGTASGPFGMIFAFIMFVMAAAISLLSVFLFVITVVVFIMAVLGIPVVLALSYLEQSYCPTMPDIVASVKHLLLGTEGDDSTELETNPMLQGTSVPSKK